MAIDAATRGVLYEKVLKITGKNQSLFFSKVSGLRSATSLKKRLWHRCFPLNFANFLKTPLFTEHLPPTASVATLTERQEKVAIGGCNCLTY